MQIKNFLTLAITIFITSTIPVTSAATSASGSRAVHTRTTAPTAKTPTRVTKSTRVNAAALRRGFTYIDQSTLAGRNRRSPAEAVSLSLFRDLVVDATLVHFETRENGDFTWFGRANGQVGQDVVLTVVDGEMAGVVHVGGRMFRLGPYHHGYSSVREIQRSPNDREHGALSMIRPSRAEQNGRGGLTPVFNGANPGRNEDTPFAYLPDDGSTIDVLVAYEADASIENRNILLEIQQAVDQTNWIFAESGISTRLQLVYAIEVFYDLDRAAKKPLAKALKQLTDPNDFELDYLHLTRDSFAADIVALVVARPDKGKGKNCGWANMFARSGEYYDPDSNKVAGDDAFFVVGVDCMVERYSFAHEIGHTLGARHDWYKDSRTSPFDYSHGFINLNAGVRTIMSYPDACNASGVVCEKLPRFSNPQLWYSSNTVSPTLLGIQGSRPTDNRRSINNMALEVANHRLSATR